MSDEGAGNALTDELLREHTRGLDARRPLTGCPDCAALAARVEALEAAADARDQRISDLSRWLSRVDGRTEGLRRC